MPVSQETKQFVDSIISQISKHVKTYEGPEGVDLWEHGRKQAYMKKIYYILKNKDAILDDFE